VSRVNVRVRPATHDDIPALVQLLQHIDLSSGLFSGKPLHDPSAAHLTERFGEVLDSDRCVLIATDEAGAVVGMLAAKPDDVGAIDLTPVLHVTHLMVDPEHRRRGIGRALLERTVEWARGTGVTKLELHVFPYNEAAIRLYESFGFRREGLRERHYRRDGELVDAVLMAYEVTPTLPK
jgi:ribosomal protein S18 acetylase RimI-like enzyme